MYQHLDHHQSSADIVKSRFAAAWLRENRHEWNEWASSAKNYSRLSNMLSKRTWMRCLMRMCMYKHYHVGVATARSVFLTLSFNATYLARSCL
jgi:hypothetical protein